MTPSDNKNTDRIITLKKSFIITFILGFIAYGYVFVNYTPSHDGMMIIKTNQWWEMSVGRFVVMYYGPLRGLMESPWLIGMLTMAFTTLSVWLTVEMLGIKADTWRVFVVSSVYVLNIAYIANSCVYIFCWDLLALALLAAVYAAYLIIRYDRIWAYALAALMIALSLGMYQSYITVTFGLYLIVICKWLIEDEEIRVIARRFGLFCATMPVAAALYLALVKICQALKDVQPYEGEYESISNLRTLSPLDILRTIPTCYKQVIQYFITRTTYDTMANRYLNALLFLAGVVVWIWFIRKWNPEKNKKTIAVAILVIVICIFPLGINAVSLLMGGQIYHMMIFSYQLVYILALFPALSSIDTIALPKLNRSIRLAVPILIISSMLSFCVIRYSNDILYYQKLVGEGTASSVTNIVYDMERNEEFDKETTPIVVLGNIGDAIGEKYEYWWVYSNTGGMTKQGSTITYNQCFEWYTKYVLGKHYIFNTDSNVTDKLTDNPEVVSMPAYPYAGYSKVIDGYMVLNFE